MTQHIVVIMTTREAEALTQARVAELAPIERKLARAAQRKLLRQVRSDRRVPQDTRATEMMLNRWFRA